MGIETARADRKGKEFRELPTDTNTSPNSRPKRTRRRQKKILPGQKKMLPVQKLFEICKEVFANGGTGIVPCSEDIERLRAVLGMLFFSLIVFELNFMVKCEIFIWLCLRVLKFGRIQAF